MSEETEVKSKQELIEKWESAIEAAEFYGKGKEERLISYMKDFVSDLNQLDEPEVLSQDFIDKYTWNNHYIGRPFVYVDDLQSLLVPKQEREQKYYVDLGTAAYVAKWDGNDQVDIYTDAISGSDEFEFHLTKKEIEAFDKRYLALAIPVDGIDSAISDIESGRINTYESFDELLKELEE